MPKLVHRLRHGAIALVFVVLTIGCATESEPPQATTPGLPPVNKAKNAAQDAQQKASEREQIDPEKQQQQPGQ
ncbi:hypothetical protein H6F90_07595 [Trichocoleus sp. FACHB-591]|uniref:hypothetical protein n=1 Tax=Trichocoleus sp. FACHB-591 TaxID=2692872 RepID=UPI001682A771|nr:hypothetical protein [Trichocoleus sp. FACHB-591]MBD2095019.1 hypothetical protein [Trichocoleus sp. FACHB-591]